VTQAVRHRPLTSEARVRTRVIPCGICGGESGSGTGFSPSSSVFTSQYNNPPLLQTHLSPPLDICNRSDQAALHHTFGNKLGASCLTRHLAGTDDRSIILLYSVIVPSIFCYSVYVTGSITEEFFSCSH
jgi:hypothetical protein